MTAWHKCPECDGDGIVDQETYDRYGISAKAVTCDNCWGSGEIEVELDDLLEEEDQ